MFTALLKLISITLITITLFLVPISAFAYGGDIDITGSLQRGLKAFPLKSTFQIDKTLFEKEYFVTKSIEEKTYHIKRIKKENGIEFYTAVVLGDSFTYYINVDEKTNEIIYFAYDILQASLLNGIDYNDTYNTLLTGIIATYGEPTKEGSTEYQGKTYKYAQFYEKGKYEYFLGITQSPSNKTSSTFRFIVLKAK